MRALPRILIPLGLLLLTQPARGDEIILKNGNKVVWKSLVDKGDCYEVETEKSLKIIIRKEDIEKIVPIPSTGPLTGATFTKLTGKVKAHDALSIIDVSKDVATGPEAKVKMQGSALYCDLKFDKPSKIKIPVKVTEEYDLALTVERRSGISDFFVILVSNGNPLAIQFDGDQCTMSGIQGSLKQNEGSKALLAPKKVTQLLFQVRPGGAIKVTLDGKTFIEQQPAGSNGVTSAVDPFLYFGSQKIFGTPDNLWIVTKATLTVKE